MYCRSAVQDKISDYEDLWGNDAINSPIGKSVMSSFRSTASHKIHDQAHKKSQLVLTPVEIPLSSTNPFSVKLHHSSNNISTMAEPKPAGFVRHAINRLSLDLSNTPTSDLLMKPTKDWSPFYSDPVDTLDEFDETASRRHHDNDTLKRADKEGKRRGIAVDPWIADTSWEYVMQNLSLKKPDSKVDVQIAGTKPSGLHQLIAEKAPELHLDELSIPHIEANESSQESESVRTLTRNNRVSSYDNVERQLYASSATYSDEGTVFSEPWDNSQWEKIIPESKNAIFSFFC